MSKGFIVRADKFVMCVTWVLVSLLRLAVLPLHIVALLLFHGCDHMVTYTTEMQAATVARLKASD